jgi:hypothetical protein
MKIEMPSAISAGARHQTLPDNEKTQMLIAKLRSVRVSTDV